jgi:thiamine-phosphate pyrophosphorylase
MKRNFDLYLMMSQAHVGERDFLDVLKQALEGGITCFQFCENEVSAYQEEQVKELALQSLVLCKSFGIPFMVYEDVEFAMEIGADGVHVESGKDLVDIRKTIGPDRLLGVATKSEKEAFAASEASVNYISVGPVYVEQNQNVIENVTGTDLIREIVGHLPGMTVIASGGISERRVGEVIRAGAKGIMVNTAILEGEDPFEATRRLKGRILLSLTGVEM